MTIFNIHKNKAICVLPWVHEHLDLSSNKRPCCHGRPLLNGRNIMDIRKEMLVGEKPLECLNCYKQESNNESSTRIRETIDWIKKFGEPKVEEPIIQFLDIRNDPTCNLKCKTCGPTASTLWAKEKNIKPVLPEYNLDVYNKKELKKVYFAGGEPTYNKSYLNFLKDLFKINPDCEVIINSNLKRLPNEWKDIISNFKNLTVIISCDAIETLGCYVRYPLNWKEFEENVKFVTENANYTMFNLVPSNLTVHKINETVKWMSTYTNNISLTVVDGGLWEHQAVPIEFRKSYVESLNKLTNFKISSWEAHKFRLNLQSLIIKYQSTDYDPILHTKLKEEIAEQDSHRTTQLKDVDPFLHSWIFG